MTWSKDLLLQQRRTGIPYGKNTRNLWTGERNDMQFNGRNTVVHLAEVHINFNHVGWLGNFSRQTEERKETASLRGRYEFTVSCFLFGNVAQGTCSAAGAVGAVVLDVPSLSSPAAARKGSPAAFSWNHGSIRQIMTQWSGVLVPLFVSFFFFFLWFISAHFPKSHPLSGNDHFSSWIQGSTLKTERLRQNWDRTLTWSLLSLLGC